MKTPDCFISPGNGVEPEDPRDHVHKWTLRGERDGVTFYRCYCGVEWEG